MPDLTTVFALVFVAIALPASVYGAWRDLRSWRAMERTVDQALGISSEEHRE